MRIRRLTRVAVLLLLLLLTASSTSRASEAQGIEEMVVTGRGRAEPLQKVPLSIAAFSASDLDARGMLEIEDLGRSVAGLKLDTTVATSNTARVFIRGVGQANESDEVDPGVAIYVDGVYYPRLLGSVIPLLDLERVEVLRGPQGTLSGASSVGGAILLTTRKPGAELGGEAQVRAGNRGLLETRASVDLPLSEWVFSRISLATATDDGYVENVLDGENAGDNKLLAGRASLRLLPVDSLEASLSFERSHERERAPLAECRQTPILALGSGGVDNVSFAREACAESSATSKLEAFSNHPIENQLDIVGASSRVTWSLGSSTLRALSSWRQVANRTDGGDLDYTREELLGTAPGKNKFDTVTHELVWQGAPLGDRLRVTAGAYFLREEGRSKFEQTVQRNVIANPDIPLVGSFAEPEDQPLLDLIRPFFGAVPTFRVIDFALGSGGDPQALTPLELLRNANRLELKKVVQYSYAGFGDVTLALTDALSVSVGARYTEERKARQRKSIPVFGPSFDASGNVKADSGFDSGSGNARFGEWQGRVTLSCELGDVLLFGGVSSGFRPGGFDDSGVTDRAAAVEPFETEKLRSYELGLKTAWLSNRLVLNLTGFYNDYDDIQTTIMTISTSGLPVVNIQNAKRAVVQGLELELAARPSWLEGLGLSGGLSLIHADYKEFRDTVLPDFTSDRCASLRLSECQLEDLAFLVGQLRAIQPQRDVDVSDREFNDTPALSFNVRAEYALDVGRWGRLVPSLEWYHQRKTFQDVRNTPRARQPTFGLLSGRLGWQLADGRTTVALFGRNLLDRRYPAGSFDLRQQFGQIQVFYAPPRSYGLEITRSFGGR